MTAMFATFLMLGLAGLAMAATPVSLGTADTFAVLAGSAVTVTTPSVISGDVGLSPAAGTFYTGLTTGMVTGTIYAVDATGPAGNAGNDPALLTTAQNDLTTAYNNATGQTPATAVLANSVDSFSGTGYTLTPGVYNSGSTMGITGTLTLDGGGNPDAVFVFQAGSSLTTASNSRVTLINGAQACNVFWQVGSSATLGTGTQFSGNILAFSSITDNGGSTINGRLLARNAAVTLNNTNVTKATCASVSPTSSPSSGGTGAIYFPQLPAISLVKVPTPSALPLGPGFVTYKYIVTNPGKVALNTVWVKDNLCAPVQYISGDTNGNSLLDIGETWTYACTKMLSQTETNIATAHGYGVGLGMDVYATANATVVVSVQAPTRVATTTTPVGQVLGTSTPSLPNTGFPPEANTDNSWNILVSVVALVLVSGLAVVFNKHTV